MNQQMKVMQSALTMLCTQYLEEPVDPIKKNAINILRDFNTINLIEQVDQYLEKYKKAEETTKKILQQKKQKQQIDSSPFEAFSQRVINKRSAVEITNTTDPYQKLIVNHKSNENNQKKLRHDKLK